MVCAGATLVATQLTAVGGTPTLRISPRRRAWFAQEATLVATQLAVGGDADATNSQHSRRYE
ncbi:MAG: hypothetical protein NZ843_06200 [Fimbriimonadales bacterium]|nr:hypothetical protein [Fimbriimonadales bacterium]